MTWWLTFLFLPGAAPVTDPPPASQTSEAVSPPRPIAASFMSNMDYPREAVRLRQEGLSVVLVHVDAKGKVRACIVEQSSGSPSLDAATCTLARRQRFTPARNAEGKAVEGDAPWRMVWRLPPR